MKSIRDRFVKEISKEIDIDPRVVSLISNFEFKYARERMADEDDIRPVRLRYLAAFVPKTTYEREFNEKHKSVENE